MRWCHSSRLRRRTFWIPGFAENDASLRQVTNQEKLWAHDDASVDGQGERHLAALDCQRFGVSSRHCCSAQGECFWLDRSCVAVDAAEIDLAQREIGEAERPACGERFGTECSDSARDQRAFFTITQLARQLKTGTDDHQFLLRQFACQGAQHREIFGLQRTLASGGQTHQEKSYLYDYA